MSKRARKVAFADEVQVEEDKRRREDGAGEDEEDDPESGDRGKKSECAPIGIISPLIVLLLETRFKLKHSLDSDEEDEKDEVKDSHLGDEDLAAQEDSTIVRNPGIHTHPFLFTDNVFPVFFLCVSCTQTCMHMYTYTNTHTQTQAHTHIHTLMYIQYESKKTGQK